ncbi:hypothetical protein [Roseixanthobacter glucoisosaccharinicivorans]|uniref:hypothetical protein n=1 Tax=Roseixanthobacter glucoisosaccharinicivorans TaxID=3119923 RepID=UPI00372B3E7A
MSVRIVDPARIVLEGACPAEDAETLLGHLCAHPGARVDWRGCESAHAAVVQVLLATGVVLHGPPAGRFLRSLVAPALKNSQE